MIILSKEQVLKLHASLIKATGGSDGIRDEGMLDLALNNPFQSFDGKELYPSIQAKAVRLKNHNSHLSDRTTHHHRARRIRRRDERLVKNHSYREVMASGKWEVVLGKIKLFGNIRACAREGL